MFTIDDLADRLGGYLPPDEIQQVKRAFYYAEQAHDGQRRRSGRHHLGVEQALDEAQDFIIFDNDNGHNGVPQRQLQAAAPKA